MSPKLPSIPRLLLLTACAAAFSLTGCANFADLCRPADKESQAQEKKNLKKGIAKSSQVKAPPMAAGSLPFAPLARASQTAPTTETYIRLTAGTDVAGPLFTGIPNSSRGKFIAQVSITYSGLTGITSGQTFGALQLSRGATHLYLGASPDTSVNGFGVFVGDNVRPPLATMSFQDIYRIDLQIEQTDTQLIFRARPTQDPAGGAWSTVDTENIAVTPDPLALTIGMGKQSKGCTFYYFRLALDGEGIGGTANFSIISKLRDSVEALADAQTKISAATPDLAGALADLDTATAANQSARNLLDTAVLDDTLQTPFAAFDARKILEKLKSNLSASRAAIGSQNLATAKSQLGKLDKIARSQQGVMAVMLGWRSPAPAKIPQDLFSFRIP